MKQQIKKNLVAFYACRILILEASFITKEERQEALDMAYEYHDAPPLY